MVAPEPNENYGTQFVYEWNPDEMQWVALDGVSMETSYFIALSASGNRVAFAEFGSNAETIIRVLEYSAGEWIDLGTEILIPGVAPFDFSSGLFFYGGDDSENTIIVATTEKIDVFQNINGQWRQLEGNFNQIQVAGEVVFGTTIDTFFVRSQNYPIQRFDVYEIRYRKRPLSDQQN